MLQRTIIFTLLVFCSLLLLSACSNTVTTDTKDSAAEDSDGNLATRTISGSFKGALDAVQTPFEDLNLTRDEIPEALQKITGNPYEPPVPMQCKAMKEELVTLNAALGPDMEKSAGKAKGIFDKDMNYSEEGASMLQSEAINFVAGKASVIPFRGFVRQVTGAAKHSKELATAYESGKLRRAYLKGLRVAMKCDKAKTAVTEHKTAKKDLDV